MRFSLTTVAALALLGAESLFLGVSATPLGPARNNDSNPYQGLCPPGHYQTTEGCLHKPETRAGGGGRLVGVGAGKGGGKGDDGSSSGGAGKSGSNKGDEGSSGPNPGSFKDIGVSSLSPIVNSSSVYGNHANPVPKKPKKTYPPKAIPNPFQGGRGYELRDSDKTAADYTRDYGKMYGVWTPRYAGGKEPVYRIGVRDDDNSINTLDAFNNKQRWGDDTVHKDTNIELSDMQMYFFVNKAGKSPQDLSIMRYDNIVEDKTEDVIEAARERFPGPDGAKASELTATSKAANGSPEQELFQELSQTPLGMNVDKTIQQFGVGKQVDSFKITSGSGEVHLEVVLR